MKLWKRAMEVTVGETLITGLRMQFKVLRHLKGEPNTAELKIWNLSQDTRSKMQVKGIPVLIEAGYEESISQVFLGNMRTPTHVRDVTDLVTTMQAGDGETATRASRINHSFAKGVSVGDVLKVIAEKLSVNVEDAVKKLKNGQIRGVLTEFVNGFAASGSAWNELERLLSSTGLEASIQDGELQVLEKGQPNQAKAVLLRTDSGLIGSPEIGEKGLVKAKSLLQPGIYPGRKVEITSKFVDGFFRCDSVMHSGDTWGQEWYSEIEGSPL